MRASGTTALARAAAGWIALPLAIALAGCGASTGPSAPPSSSPEPTDASGFLLRATISQALPPTATFSTLPALEITADLRVIETGPIDMIFPGPLMPNVQERPLSPEGWTAIVDAARAAGLLGTTTDFTNGVMVPGGQLARLEIVVDGVRYDLRGSPIMPPCAPPGCPTTPGTQLAFAAFWAQLTGIDAWLPGALGPPRPFQAQAVALLVGPPPNQQPGLTEPVATWPLATSPHAFGQAWAQAGYRCGIVRGPELAAIAPLLAHANQLTQWVAAPGASAAFGITPRPLLPGEPDPCQP